MPYTPTRQQLRWAALLVLSVALSAGFDATGLPAGRLLGPMVAAIALAVFGFDVHVPRAGFVAAQGVIGCLIARGVPATIFTTLVAHWAAFLAGVLAVTIIANALGWLLSRWEVLPGDTAIWGSAPGGASAMMIMAADHGADVRLVAFMQYLRVVCVTVVASLVAHWWTSGTGVAAPHPAAAAPSLLLGPSDWSAFGVTLVIALAGGAVGQRVPIPAGGLLLPMAVAILLQDVSGMSIELPPLLLAAAYAIIGWTIGTRFNRQVLVATVQALPQMLAAVLALILLCGVFAAALVRWAHVDPLTAYLATSPGGADSVAIIAAGTAVDMPFVLTMQVLRMLFVMATGPAIARMLARQADQARQRRTEG